MGERSLYFEMMVKCLVGRVCGREMERNGARCKGLRGSTRMNSRKREMRKRRRGGAASSRTTLYRVYPLHYTPVSAGWSLASLDGRELRKSRKLKDRQRRETKEKRGRPAAVGIRGSATDKGLRRGVGSKDEGSEEVEEGFENVEASIILVFSHSRLRLVLRAISTAG